MKNNCPSHAELLTPISPNRYRSHLQNSEPPKKRDIEVLNRIMIRYIFFIVLLLPITALAEEVIAVIDLKFLKDTGEVASTLCFEDENNEKDCATWATFYLFEARVNSVVSGELSARKFRVWFGVHALKKGNIKNMVAKLRPLPPEHEAAYQIIAWGEKKELYCFGTKENEAYNTNIKPEGTNMQCYGYEVE